VLLGILLYVVLGIVKQAVDPDPLELQTNDTPENVAPPAINTRTDLELALKNRGLNIQQLIDRSVVWYEQQGFLGELKLYGISEADSLSAAYEGAPAAELIARAGAGDVAAAQALADNAMLASNADPLEAIDWYRQAAGYGSVYAMFRISELFRIFANKELDAFNSDPVYAAKLATLREQNPLIERDSLAWAITAVLAGGLPVASNSAVANIKQMAAEAGETGTARACEKAMRLLLDLAAERRSLGRLVFATEPPALFVSVPTLDSAIPCGDYVEPVTDTSACKLLAVPGLVNPNQNLWLCE